MDKVEQLESVLGAFALEELLFSVEWHQWLEEAGKSSYSLLERPSRQKDQLVLPTDTGLKLGGFS